MHLIIKILVINVVSVYIDYVYYYTKLFKIWNQIAIVFHRNMHYILFKYGIYLN